MQKDGCERVIVFGDGLRHDKEEPWEEFHSFELQAPKTYLIEKLRQMQEKQMEAIYHAMEKAMPDNIMPDVPFLLDD